MSDRVPAKCAVSGWPVAKIHLERADDPLPIARHDARARRRVDVRQQPVQPLRAAPGGEPVEAVAQRLVGAGPGNRPRTSAR